MKGQPTPIRVILRAYGEEHECELLPTGWAENSASWKFDVDSFGFNLKYSTENLRFVAEDAVWMRKQLDKYGISTEVDVIIQKRQNNWTYKDYFIAQTDFSGGYVNERDFLEVGIYEGGFKKSISTNGKTNYEIGFDDAAVDIEVPEGVTIFETVKHNFDFTNKVVEEYIPPDEHSPGEYVNVNEQTFNVDIIKDSSYTSSYGLIFQSSQQEGANGRYGLFLKTIAVPEEKIYSANIKLDLTYKETENSPLDKTNGIKIYVVRGHIIDPSSDQLISEITQEQLFNNNADIYLESNIQISTDTSPQDYTLYIGYSVIANVAQGTSFELSGESTISFYGDEKTTSFTLKAYKYEDFGNKLLQKLHPGATFSAPVLSEFTDDNMQLFITTTDAVRGLREALIKTNFNEFKKQLSCILSTGERCDNATKSYEITNKKAVFDPDKKILDLGRVKELRIEQLPEEWMFNVFRFGYPKQKYDFSIGRQEFAAELEFASDLKIPIKKMGKICDYISAYISIHLIHYEYSTGLKEGTDEKDNTIFMILASWNGTKWQAVPGSYRRVSGLEGNGYFNIGLSPHWNLRRNADYIRSILDKISPVLTYVSGTETMSDISSEHNGIQLTEKTNEDTSTGVKLFRPAMFKCKAVVPQNLPEILGENPNGYIEFTYNGHRLKGFPIQIDGTAAAKSEQEVYMVMHPETPDNIQSLLYEKRFFI